MKRRYFYYLAALIVSVLCLFPLSALGNPIDVEQALKAVENYRKKPARNGARRAPALAKGKLQHAYTKKTAAGAPAVYVFNTGEGFILASADDSTVPVLGYSDNGDFDPNNIPDGLRYMLGEYANQMAALPPRKAGAALPTPTYEVESTVAVSPLIQSHWDQQEPYNIECPPALSPTGRAATGCMTTAIAQIMRYHQWPQTKGFSSREMEAAQGLTSSSQVRDYYLRNYQWNLMHYNASQYTKTSGGGYNFSASDVKAVSQLMMDVAVGLSTEFGGTSSAVNIAIIPMLLSYFNYDASIEEVKLSKCNSVEEFNHIVITDLLAGRPVYFQGGPNSSGHAFVCDGYDGEGRFHINWGWSGTADGYFLITGLSPSEAGTGGVANNGYSENLLAIHNIMPCRDGVLTRPEVKAYYASDIAPGYEIARENNNYYFCGTFGVYPQLPSQRNFRGKIGLYIVDSFGQGQEVWDATQEYTQILRTNPYHDFKVKLQSDWAEEGTHIYYIYKECGADSWKYMYTTRGDQCCFSIEVNADGELVAVANNMEYNLDALIGGTMPTVQITYNVNLNGNSIGSITVAEKIGQAPSKSFVPEYYVETSGFPDEVPSTATTYTINSNYNSKLPFTPGTTAYNVTFNTDGNSYLWYDNGTPHEQMNAAASAGDNANAQWRFQGDWLNGFTIQNVGTSKYITTMDDETSNARTLSAPSPLSGRSYFLLQHRNDGFYFKLKDSELYLAHTNPTKLEISSFNQKGYSGNLVTFTQPGNVPQPTGVTYTVDISGQPEDANPVVYYGTQSYGDGSQFTAVNLDSSSLYASPIEGYTAEINVGAGTVYVVYTANANTSVTYSVSITGYPSGQAPQLFYNGQPVVGTTLTASDLLLSQLSATHIDNYTCDIRIASKSITVTYTAISYVTYTVSFTGVPTGQSPKLYYNGQAVSGTQFTAGNLTLEQLYADALTDYSYKISISGSTITVMYYPLEFYFDTTTGYGITTLTKEPVTVRYYDYGGKNNIYGTTTQYTEVKSTGEPIVKIVFAGIESFSGINASVGTLDRTTGVWTSPEGGVASVRFTGGDGYSTGLTVSLKSSDTPTPTPTTYSISFSGHPTGQSPQLYYNDEAVSGTQLTATNLNISQLSATTIAGYTYHISIGTNTISVVYTPNAPAGTTYTVSISGAPSGQTPVLYYNGQPVGTQFTATNLNSSQLSATDIAGYTYTITIGTNTISVVYTAESTPEPPTSGTYTLGSKLTSISQVQSGKYYAIVRHAGAGYATYNSTTNKITGSTSYNDDGTAAFYFTGDNTNGYTIKSAVADVYFPVLSTGQSNGTAIVLSSSSQEKFVVEDYDNNLSTGWQIKSLGSNTTYNTTHKVYINCGATAGDFVGYHNQSGGNTQMDIYAVNFTPDEPAPTGTTYTVTVTGAPTGAVITLDGNSIALTGGSYTVDKTLSLNDLSANEPDGYYVEKSYNETSHTFTVAYHAYLQYTVAVTGTTDPNAGVIYGGETYHAGQTIYVKTALGATSLQPAEVTGYEGTVSVGTSSITVSYTLSAITYTVTLVNAPTGAVVTLDGQDFTASGTYAVSKALSLADLSVTEPDGYYADKAYDPATHTFTVTFHECYLYPVVVVGTSDAAAGVVYDGVTYHHGESIQAKTPLYATSVTPASVTGQEGSVTFENNTFTVTYRLMKAVDLYFYREGVYSNERYTFQKEGVNVTCWNYNPGWTEYASANVYPSDNYSLIVSSEFAISKIEMYLCTTGGYTNSGKFNNFSATNGYFSPNGDMATWTGSANEVTFTVSTGDIYIGHMVIYIAGPTEEEQALQEIEEARVEIADGSLGYPVLTQALRSDPNMAAYVAYYDDPTGYTGTLADLQASYDYFLTHCDEVNRPAPGHAYKLSVRSSDGTKRWYLTDGGGLTTTASSAAVFVMGGTDNEDYNTLFATNDNTASHYLQNNGATATAYTASTCDFNLVSMLRVQSTNVNTQPASRLGTFSLTSSARHDDATLPGTLVIDESNETWSKADTPFMNGSFTSAIEMEEVEYPYTRPNLVSGTEGSHEGVFATVWLPFPMIFPEGVEVYKGTQQHTAAGQSYLALERVDTDHAVARGGYILYSETLEAGAIDVLPAPSAPTDTHLDTDAVFIGSTDLNTDGSSLYWTLLAGKNPYVLANKSKGIGFYRYTGTTFPKGKAIWLAPEPETAETVKFGFEDVIEAIKSLHGYGSDTLIYDLNGHRLDKVQKGQVNVVNGKKIMIK